MQTVPVLPLVSKELTTKGLFFTFDMGQIYECLPVNFTKLAYTPSIYSFQIMEPSIFETGKHYLTHKYMKAFSYWYARVAVQITIESFYIEVQDNWLVFMIKPKRGVDDFTMFDLNPRSLAHGSTLTVKVCLYDDSLSSLFETIHHVPNTLAGRCTNEDETLRPVEFEFTEEPTTKIVKRRSISSWLKFR
jgi:hypothetical protein